MRCRASGRDTELHRVAARPPVPLYVGSHDAPRRVAPPQEPWRSSGARVGKPDRVHPGTWQHVRCHLRMMPSRPPREWLRGGQGFLPPTTVRKDGRGAQTTTGLRPRQSARTLEWNGFQLGILFRQRRQRQEGTRPRKGYGSLGRSRLWRAQPQGRHRHETRPDGIGAECKA